jgi:hypothetical protein
VDKADHQFARRIRVLTEITAANQVVQSIGDDEFRVWSCPSSPKRRSQW